MPRAGASGVRGLYKQPDGRWMIDLRWKDPRTNTQKRHTELLPTNVDDNTAKERALEILNSALIGRFKRANASTVRTHRRSDGKVSYYGRLIGSDGKRKSQVINASSLEEAQAILDATRSSVDRERIGVSADGLKTKKRARNELALAAQIESTGCCPLCGAKQ
jgi:hypothetical protein